MKKIISMVMVLVLAAAPVMAATTSSQVTASASVQSAFALDMVIVQNDAGATSNVSALNFGQLANNGAGGLTSTRFFTVYLSAKTQTQPYNILQTGQSMTNGTVTLPNNAQRVTPVYVPVDNGGATLPTGAAIGTQGTWVVTNKIIYDSENSLAQDRTVQAVYGLIGDSALGAGNFIPSNQPSGSYSGNITFTLTTT